MVEIQVRSQPANTTGAYFKMSRVAVDLAIVGVGTVITMDGGTCSDIKITLGAVAPTPIRAKKAEALIKGKKIEDGLIDASILEEKEESHEILSLDMLTANLEADENSAPPAIEE